MRYSMWLVGLVAAASASVACGGSDDNGGGGTAGKGGSNAAGTSSAGTSNGGTSSGGTGSGGGSGGTPGKVDSGIPDDKPAGQLSDDEFDAICKSFSESSAALFGEDAKKATCGFGAYFATKLSGAMGTAADSTCKMAYDECLAEPDEPSDDECTKPSAACTATVGEIETCFNDMITQGKAALADLPGCDDLDTEFEEPAETDPPASCAVVEEKCPEALE